MKNANGGIDIFAPNEFMPSKRAFLQLDRIVSEDRILKPVVALVDIHDKEKNDFPTGVVAASKTHIFPQLLVSGPNCGMRMMSIPRICDREIDKLFTAFSKELHVSSFLGEKLSDPAIFEVMVRGAEWAVKDLKDAEYELSHIENRGKACIQGELTRKNIRDAIPRSVIEISKRRMGILGKGNHFLEVHNVSNIYDQEAVKALGLTEDSMILFMHSGSGGLGSMATDLYCPRSFHSRDKKTHAFLITEWTKSLIRSKRRRYFLKMLGYMLDPKKHLFGLEEGSEAAELYLTAIKASTNFAYANRAFISMSVRKIAQRVLGIAPSSVRTIYDMSHISIGKEPYLGSNIWVHRAGAVRVFTKNMLDENSPFKKTGTPIFLPGSMGDPTYVYFAGEGSCKTYYSQGHGAGRLDGERIQEVSGSRSELVKLLEGRSVSLYRGDSKKIVTQDPRCFKNVDAAADYLEKNGLGKMAFKLKPVAVLKG